MRRPIHLQEEEEKVVNEEVKVEEKKQASGLSDLISTYFGGGFSWIIILIVIIFLFSGSGFGSGFGYGYSIDE